VADLCRLRLHVQPVSGADLGVAPNDLRYLGFPVSIVPSLPGAGSQTGKIVVAFGNLSLACALGSRRGMSIAKSADRYLEQDQTLVRGTERFDAIVANLGDNSNAGAIVGLVATAW
jgi:hypothetical protein